MAEWLGLDLNLGVIFLLVQNMKVNRERRGGGRNL